MNFRNIHKKVPLIAQFCNQNQTTLESSATALSLTLLYLPKVKTAATASQSSLGWKRSPEVIWSSILLQARPTHQVTQGAAMTGLQYFQSERLHHSSWERISMFSVFSTFSFPYIQMKFPISPSILMKEFASSDCCPTGPPAPFQQSYIPASLHSCQRFIPLSVHTFMGSSLNCQAILDLTVTIPHRS